MQKYEKPITLGPSWLEMIFGLSKETKEINERLITESLVSHYNIVREQMTDLFNELQKDLSEAEYMKRTKLNSLQILDTGRNTPQSKDIVNILFDYEVFSKGVGGKCEMMYETAEELKNLIPKKDLVKFGIEGTINSFIKGTEDIEMKLGEYKKELTDLLEKSLIEEEEMLQRKQKEYEEAEEKFKRAPKRFGDFRQTYVKESESRSGPQSGPQYVSPPGPILIPNKYFRDTVLKYTGETMTSPVADKKEIDKMYKKLSLHIHAGSTKYNKLSKSEQEEADEIFKKIKEEKEKYVPKSGKHKKKTKNKKPKKSKKSKKPKKTKKAKKKS